MSTPSHKMVDGRLVDLSPAEASAIGAEWQQNSPVAFDRVAAGTRIDDLVATVYGRFTRFEVEYDERETQARTYRDASYTGAAPVRVAEFATPAGLTGAQAADRIIQQADAIHAAQGALSGLRMRKYEVLRAPDDGTAQAKEAEITAAIAAIAASLT